MPSASPSPAKRPSIINERTSSMLSLSSSGMPAGSSTKQQARPHMVSRHSRNVSHGRGLSNMGKKSMNAVYGEGAKHHRRVKSGTSTPAASPKPAAGGHMKRNSSHVVLPRNRSAGNLRKNQSTNTLTALNRNLSRGALNKLGANVEQKAKEEAQQKQGVFDLGDNSDDEEEEGEWEDSTASPELTRNSSKVSTPSRVQTPLNNGEPIVQKHIGERQVQDLVPEKTSSPPSPVVIKPNKSAPNLRTERFTTDRPLHNPALLQQNGRASRAPPAMITANANARPSQQNLTRTDSQRSLTKKSQGQTSLSTLQDSTTSEANSTRLSSTTATMGVGNSTSTSVNVSHFLPPSPSLPRTPRDRTDSDTDSDSVSDFMATYKPLASESPDKPRTSINRARIPSQPSRTQQKLELQRRELMRGTGPQASATGLPLSVGSSVSLHNRTHSHSRARPKSMVGELKAIKQEYETSVKQLTIVRRFRNPVLESLGRLKAVGGILSDSGQGHSAGAGSGHAQKRPASRHGHARAASNTGANGTARNSTAGTTPEEPSLLSTSAHAHTNGGHRGSKVSFAQPRGGGGRDSKVTFQLSRDDSHEDILGAAHAGSDTGLDEYAERLNPEEALIRRMWESRIHVA